MEKCDRASYATNDNVTPGTSRTFWNARIFLRFINVDSCSNINKRVLSELSIEQIVIYVYIFSTRQFIMNVCNCRTANKLK